MQIIINKDREIDGDWASRINFFLELLHNGLSAKWPVSTIDFDDLTLQRLGNRSTGYYVLYGTRIQNPDYTVVGTEASTLIVEAHSAADVEVGLRCFANDKRINALNIAFPPRSTLGLPACKLNMFKSRVLLVQGVTMLSRKQFDELRINPLHQPNRPLLVG